MPVDWPGSRRYMRCMPSETMVRDETDTLPILIAPHATLRLRCRPVGPADDGAVRDLLPRMFNTMYAAPGIGLAAPQVGQELRVIVIDLMPEDEAAAARPDQPGGGGRQPGAGRRGRKAACRCPASMPRSRARRG